MSLETVAMNEISRKWGWFLAIGIIMAILGTIGIGVTFALTLTTVTFFGFLILIGGGFQLVNAFRHKGWSLVGNILIALLYGAVGYTMVKNPLLASATLTLLIAWALIAIGIMRLIIAFRLKGVPGWIWTLIGGIAAIALGIMILNNWPESSLWVIGMFVAIELILNGWGMIMIGLAAKKLRSGDIQL
ncbi:acid-resistance membrane protein [bacterium BMS3Bbin11]|nr:acid-resistance membrane protein [bacterium BMS3Abin11]GBE45537.1 acid-resistance membrane protein [bacterium BMS3Bbin11]GMT41342.1 MAG: hypothetical protein IEMM0001_2077 [bacterium]HDH08240.1 HdeD family acid-resistance protein [Gammaproteobacteria bacterium]HDH16976.1 HdeD family acid-resistance protein [Gammaproteobacteria bacterium]